MPVPQKHIALSLNSVSPLLPQDLELASTFGSLEMQPPAPTPLLFLTVAVGAKTHFALLDSGVSDSFISADVVREAGYSLRPLKTEIQVKVANGQSLKVTQYVRILGKWVILVSSFS